MDISVSIINLWENNLLRISKEDNMSENKKCTEKVKEVPKLPKEPPIQTINLQSSKNKKENLKEGNKRVILTGSKK